jgi:hypothetical protein
MARIEQVAVDARGLQAAAVPAPRPFPRRDFGGAATSFLAGHPELVRLSSGTPALAEVAAVFEDAFCLDDVAAALGKPVGTLLPAVHELLAAGILVGQGETLRFRDAELRAELYALVPEPVRAALHRTVGEVLLDRGGCASAAAAQLVKAARPGDRAVLAALDHEALVGASQHG